jgi:hypothetical protein
MNPNRPTNEAHMVEGTTSIATTPLAAQMAVPTAGYVERLMAAATGTTTGTITVAVTINAGVTDIANSALTIAAGTGARAATVVELPLVGAGTTSGVWVNEGDVLIFTPSGGTGASIGGAFTAVIRTI